MEARIDHVSRTEARKRIWGAKGKTVEVQATARLSLEDRPDFGLVQRRHIKMGRKAACALVNEIVDDELEQQGALLELAETADTITIVG